MLLTPPGVSHFKGSQVKEINLLVEQFQANLELEKCLGQVNAKRQGGFQGIQFSHKSELYTLEATCEMGMRLESMGKLKGYLYLNSLCRTEY